MSTAPTDAELLSCPDAIEPQLIHRGRRDMISPQAGNEKIKEQVPLFPNNVI